MRGIEAGRRTRALSGDASVAAFPLGGIGAGNVCLGARGELRDWEIFNRPGKGAYLPYTFFALHCAVPGRDSITRVLESRLRPPHQRSHGYYPGDVAGLPRLHESYLRGEYPFAWVDFVDPALPVEVGLTAFTPLVPLAADDSGLPAAVLRYTVNNRTDSPVDVTVVGSLANGVGIAGYERFFYPRFEGQPHNEYRDDGTVRGVYFSSSLSDDHLRHGTMALTTTDDRVTAKENWLAGDWWDGIHDFWDDLCDDGRLEPSSASLGDAESPENPTLCVGSLGIVGRLQPGQRRTFQFVLSWHFPNRPRGWLGHIIRADPYADQIVRNFYATRHDDAWAVARHVHAELPRLERETAAFHDSMFGGSIPSELVEAATANIAVLRSTTCFRLADGTFASWEGTFDDAGSCEGTCTHVWNYAQTVAYLFPELERSVRRVEFGMETEPDGRMAFRTNQIFGGPAWRTPPAVDGQLGSVIRLYREWRYSGDDTFLEALWPRAVAALEYAFTHWDTDGDLVLDAPQHNTYDIEFHGATSLTNSMFYAALHAAAAMAEHLGDHDRATRYRAAGERGAEAMDALLWNGEYYVQRIDDVDRHRYQYGDGCLSDQVFGQLLAHTVGLGHILPKEHVRQAILAVYRHNFRPDLTNHHNVQRTFALNDEGGLLVCSWPKGRRPRLPLVYCDEVWTGIEYQVAADLIYEGFLTEAMTVVAAVRDRHDGYRRNPWNEVECGNHYVRSMSSWALLLAISGYRYDAVRAAMSFTPAGHQEDFRCFFSTASGWGTVTLSPPRAQLHIQYGTVRLASIDLPVPDSISGDRTRLEINGTPADVAKTRLGSGRVVVSFEPITLSANDVLTLTCG
jgi:uncharacterized protein (DUF608 family)